MSANVYLPHLVVLSEDDANRQILNGFRNHHSVDFRQLQLDPAAGGWLKALEQFRDKHVALMRKYPARFVLIVIDFDRREDRLAVAHTYVPEDFQDRVFVLSCVGEPEELTVSMGRKKEEIGRLLAEDCDHETKAIWGHEMLSHNAGELKRLQARVKPFLFRSA